MKKNKLFTLGLIAGSMVATSCDDSLDCGCDCNQPNITGWELLKEGEVKKNLDGPNSGNAVIIYGSNLSQITGMSFMGIAAELQPAFMTDKQIVFQVPEGIEEDSPAFITTKSCPEGFLSSQFKAKASEPCAHICDNEMATTVLKVRGNSFFSPLKARFHDGNGYNIEVSSENGGIEIINKNEIKINVPSGVDPGHNIEFENKVGTSLSDFIFQDRRNMLVTNDDPDYLDKFNDGKPDVDFVKKEEFTNKVKGTAKNTDGNFSTFWDNTFTIYTYQPDGEANDNGATPVAKTPFGIFEASIMKGETSFNDYVIKFEVYVDKSKPMIGNGLCVGFYAKDPMDIRKYCAFWQPSAITWNKSQDSDWSIKEAKSWDTKGDWITVAIPMDEIKYNFATKNYISSARNNRVIPNPEGDESQYEAFGDRDGGLPFFDKNATSIMSKLQSGKSNPIANVGLLYASYDQPLSDNEPYIAVDNLRIVPKDENGGVWPMLKWGVPLRSYEENYSTSCK